MKLIIIEGTDNVGKGTLIKNLCNYYNYHNVTIRHCDKPPKNISTKEVLDFQFKVFVQEAKLINHIFSMHNSLLYHDNIIIYDRFYLGEYVYSQMFRGADPEYVKQRLLEYEKFYLNYKDENGFKPYLVTLSADSNFILSKEDGQSFSQNLEQKTKELELFKEVHEFSMIPNKLLVKVDNNEVFRTKEDILNEVINFIL